MPIITLPDGTEKSFDQAVSVFEVAKSIGSGLAKATLAGKVNGELVDASFKTFFNHRTNRNLCIRIKHLCRLR
jgi:hypothetical protein